MGFDEDIQPIIIKKKKVTGHGHHGGAWKVAYADFVTAMMALFMVLWIVGQSKQVREYVAHYFRDPGAFFENTKGGGGVLEQGQSLLGDQSTEDLLKRQEEKLKAAGEEIMSQLNQNPELAALAKQIRMEIVREGMRIELLESSESYFFDIGTANLKREAQEILEVIARQIGTLPNHVIIEGHTDSRQYSTVTGYTNFELSAERANAARRTLMTGGVRSDQVAEVRGYADRILRNQADPMDAANRRVSIVIRFEGNKGNGNSSGH